MAGDERAKKRLDRNPASFKIQYPMKNRGEDTGPHSFMQVLFLYFLKFPGYFRTRSLCGYGPAAFVELLWSERDKNLNSDHPEKDSERNF